MSYRVILFIVLLWIHHASSAQSVIINEFSQGSDGGKEWVELLVVSDGVDMRGWELGDNDDGNWHSIAEFSTHSELGSITQGTIIALFNSGDVDTAITNAGGLDTSFSDKRVILGINNTDFLIDTGPWGGTGGAFANSDGDDTPALRNASDAIIHDMAVTHPSATVSSPGSGKVKYYTGNTVGDVVDDSKWVIASSSSGTPGEPNGGDNSNWVDQSLPVELSSWFAEIRDDAVRLNWTTESEFENQGFIIERKRIQDEEPANSWYELASYVSHLDLNGQGSTTSSSIYFYDDRQISVGETYAYRLLDVDYRGVITRHNEIVITIHEAIESDEIMLHTYPNPSNSGIKIQTELNTVGTPIRIEILNIKGELVKELFSGIPENRHLAKDWDVTDSEFKTVPSGSYIVNVSGENITKSKLLTVIQ